MGFVSLSFSPINFSDFNRPEESSGDSPGQSS